MIFEKGIAREREKQKGEKENENKKRERNDKEREREKLNVRDSSAKAIEFIANEDLLKQKSLRKTFFSQNFCDSTSATKLSIPKIN